MCQMNSCPRTPLFKGTNVQGTIFQGDFCPRKLLSVMVFFLLDITILIDYRMKKKLYEQPLKSQTCTVDKSLLGPMFPWKTVLLDVYPLDKGVFRKDKDRNTIDKSYQPL